MEIDLANIIFSWLLHVDLACIVCNSDGTTWTGAAGAAGAFGGGLGLSDLFGSDVGGTATGDTSADYSGRSRLGEPVDPDTYNTDPYGSVGGGAAPQTVPPGSPPADPTAIQNIEDPSARAAAYDQERERVRTANADPDDTTAPPPQPTYTEQAADFFNRTIRDIGKR